MKKVTDRREGGCQHCTATYHTRHSYPPLIIKADKKQDPGTASSSSMEGVEKCWQRPLGSRARRGLVQ